MATFQPPPTYELPIYIDEKQGTASFSPNWLKWFVDLAEVLSSVGGGSGGVDHNMLASLQGGTANQYYHLTASEYSSAQSLIAVKTPLLALAAVTPIAAVVVLAKITGGGANGSVTFVNGLLTAYTPPT